jgi:putative endonuclease
MFYIYILYSASADKYYIGHTNNPQRRLFEHNNSDHLTFSAKYRPWMMKALFQCGDSRSSALKLERLIKKQKTRSFIEYLIQSDNLYGDLAQLVRVPHVRD